MSKARLILILSLHFTCSSIILSQPIELFSQTDIDSFQVNHPNLTSIHTLKIKGETITSLLPLQMIENIGRCLSIENTNLITLEGLQNIEFVQKSKIIISDNSMLENVDAIFNANSFPEGSELTISKNPNLSQCPLNLICDRILNNQMTLIYGNGIECENWDKVYSDCGFNHDLPNREILVESGFELWNNNHPADWEIGLHLNNDSIANFEKVNPLTEGNSAILLRSNEWIFEGFVSTELKKSFSNDYMKIDITFDYKCVGSGSCSVELYQVKDNGANNHRTIWSTTAGDSTLYKVTLKNIEPDQIYDKFLDIRFFANPRFNATTLPVISEFVIDNFKITKEITSNIDQVNYSKQDIYPNPATNFFQITSNENLEKVSVYSLNGQELISTEYNNIDISELSKGLYFVKIKTKNKYKTLTLIKQ